MTGILIGIGWLYMSGLPGGLWAPPARAALDRSAYIQRVSVEVVPVASVTEMELDAMSDQITRIWRQEGIEVHLGTGEREPGDIHLRLVLTTDAIDRQPADTSGLCVMGSIHMLGGAPDPELKVFVRVVREFVRRARPLESPGVQALEAARIIGRVAAHELGHYLLADPRHQPTGLMRARFDGAELLGPHLKPFRPPPRSQLSVVERIVDDWRPR